MTPGARQSFRDLAIAVSLANLCFLRIWAELFAVGTPSAYYLQVGATEFLAAGLDVLLLGLVFFSGARIARKKSGILRIIGITAFALVVLIQLNELRMTVLGLNLSTVRGWLANGRWWLLAIACMAGLGAAVLTLWRPLGVLRATMTVLLCFFAFVPVTFGRAVYSVWRFDPTHTLADRAPGLDALAANSNHVPSARGPRTVVLLFDELDRRLLFDDRPADLDLPNFDRFRADAVDFESTFQAGTATNLAIPALFSGVVFSSADPEGPRALELESGAGSTSWKSLPNPFRAVQALGGQTVVVGWYHPYCRILDDDLDACAWHPNGRVMRLGSEASLPRAMAIEAVTLIPYLSARILHGLTHRAIVEGARAAVMDDSPGLVFVHLSVPHRPWIYDRHDERFTPINFPLTGYLDNMALADRALGELRAGMEEAGTWRDSNVLVLSDHSWRSSTSFDGRTDLRVPYMLKLAGESEGGVYSEPFGAEQTAALLVALARGDVEDRAGLVEWVAEDRGGGEWAVEQDGIVLDR